MNPPQHASSLADQFMHDLHWVIESPSLINSAPVIPPLSLDVIDPDHLTSVMVDPQSRHVGSHRVGYYFERLVLYWLVHLRRVEVVAHGMQIKDDKRTLGEIDFLFRDEAGRLTHWEVSVKFYLYHPQHALSGPLGGSHFLGPNARDTFERKMGRLFEHQLPLSQTHLPDVEVRQAWVQGQIFYHRQLGSVQPLPAQMSPDHLRGSYLYQREINELQHHANSRFQVLEKPYWLAGPMFNAADPNWCSGPEMADTLHQHFKETDRPLMLCQADSESVQSESLPNESTETRPKRRPNTKRIFVVADSWPLTDSSS
ncbi:DUF1853 family protein [Neorhodopirellula lusitana]|uniref:DUF1853 family protein n=1 Tax=Neorhodopirellula lusitana TaxID=445327 RepID=UPI00384A73BD